MIIFKYIFKRLLGGTVLLTTVMVFAVWLIQSIRFLDMIVNRNVSLGGYFHLISFLIPDLFVIIFPICMFISILFFYNKFQSDHELVIWQSSGMSFLSIARPAFVLSVLVVGLTLFLNIFVLPSSYKHFKDHEHEVRQQFSSAMLHEGRFNNIKGATVYIKRRYRNGSLRGILLYHIKNDKPYTLMAKEGRMHVEGDRLFLYLKDGVRQEVDVKTKSINTLHFDTLYYDLSDVLQGGEGRSKRPYEKSIRELLTPSASMDAVALKKHRAAAHQRILQPLVGFAYALFALVFMLKGPFSRRGRSKRMAGALGAGFIFQALITVCINQNSQNFESVYVAYFLLCACIVILFSYLGGFFQKYAHRVRGRHTS